MSQFQQALQAIKNIDFNALKEILDDDKSYMEVSKSLFIKTLKDNLQCYINQGLKTYQEKLIGKCDNSCDSCKAYSFCADGFPYLNLCISEIGGEINDIQLCHNIVELDRDVNNFAIFFRFFEEDKVNYKPSLKHLFDKQRVEDALDDFKKITKSKLICIEDLIYWKDKYHYIMDTFGLNAFFLPKQYKVFEEFDNLMFEVIYFIGNCDDNDYAIKALEHYHNIKNMSEKELVKWLFKYEELRFYFNFDDSEHWEKTGLIRLSEDLDIIVDCSECIEIFKFAKIYYTEETKLMEKYEPTEEHQMQNKDSLICSLENYLRLHGKHLDILP